MRRRAQAPLLLLAALLRANGISPTEDEELAEEYRLWAKSRESARVAVRVYKDPDAGIRTETFLVLMVVAWNALLQAMRLGRHPARSRGSTSGAAAEAPCRAAC